MLKSLVRSFMYKKNREMNAIRWYDRTDYGKVDVSDDRRPMREETLSAIFEFFDKIELFYGADAPAPLQIAGGWRRIILENMPNVVRAISQKDRGAYRALLENMFRNEVVVGLWNFCYFKDLPANRKPPNGFLAAMDGYKFITGRPEQDLFCSGFGNPWGCKVGNGRLSMTAGENGVKAFNLLNLLSLYPKGQKLTVMDLGSGYGIDMCQLVSWHKEPLRIILLDIPVNLATAYAFVSENFANVRRTLVRDRAQLRKTLDDRSNDVEFIFVPTLFVDDLAGEKINVLHNHGSLAEMDRETVAYYLDRLVAGNNDFFLELNSANPVAFDKAFTELDSRTFPVPQSHQLVSRTPIYLTSRGGRYLQNLYVNRSRLALAP